MPIASPDVSGGRWITIKGRHVYVGPDGKLSKGPEHLNGKTWDQADALNTPERNEVNRWTYDFKKIREADRAGAKTPFMKKRLETLNAAYEKLPVHQGPAYRGLKNLDPASLKKLISSKSLTTEAFSSFAAEERQGLRFAGKSKPGLATALLRVKVKTGRLIEDYVSHAYAGENEVLMKKGVQFRVKGVTKTRHPNGHELHIIDAEEA